MLYITITLVASGLFLIIYSLFTSSHKKPYLSTIEPPTNGKNGYLHEEDIKTAKEPGTIEELTAINTHSTSKINDFDTKSLNLNIPDDDSEGTEENDWRAPELDDLRAATKETDRDNIDDRIYKNEKEARISDKLEGKAYSAILYEDSSNILDYDNRSSIIDSTLKEYEKIKRMGKGMLELKDKCISFTSENKTYRYDFHRITKIRGGNNYLSLFIKKSKPARLFIFDKDSSIGIKLERIFNDYSRGAR
jgi:hypothetical protein